MSPDNKPEVECRISFSTTVDDMTEVYAFLMEHEDKVGPNPTIDIHPDFWYTDEEMEKDDPQGVRKFHVSISGRIDQEPTNGGSISSHEGRAD